MNKHSSKKILALALSALVLLFSVACTISFGPTQAAPTQVPAPTQTPLVVTATPEPEPTEEATEEVQPTSAPASTPTAVQPTAPASTPHAPAIDISTLTIDKYVSPTCDGYETALGGVKVRVMSTYFSIRDKEGNLVRGLIVTVEGKTATPMDDGRYRLIWEREGTGRWVFDIYVNNVNKGSFSVEDPCAD